MGGEEPKNATGSPDSAKEAAAAAKAAKAQAKALRPWYKKKRFLIPLGGLVLIVLIVIAAAGEDPVDVGDETREGAGTEAGDEEPTTAGLNEPARDGKFEFVVKGIECGRQRVGSPEFGKEAQGQYCFLSVRVTNIGDEAQFLFADNQYLFDSEGRRFSADSEAAVYSDQAETIFEEINPGNSIEGAIIFDIPEGVTPVRVELHDSAFSGGIEVRLT